VAMPATHTEWTVDMLDALPDDGQRYEIIDGELFMTPSPADVHQYVVGELHARLLGYLRRSGVGHPVVSPSDVRREDRRTNRVQPDVFVVRVTNGKRPAFPFDLADLLLAVEVTSPGNPRYDHQTKRVLYLKAEIPEYWVVNPEARTVSRWSRLEDPGEVLSERLTWRPAGMDTSFALDVPEFFATALGEDWPATT
jgi:Uma2 family endonuclease